MFSLYTMCTMVSWFWLLEGTVLYIATTAVATGCAWLQVVDLRGEVMEKPDDAAHAKRMLSALSGHEHQVHTGVHACQRVRDHSSR